VIEARRRRKPDASLPEWIEAELTEFATTGTERLAVVAALSGATRAVWRRSAVREFLQRTGLPDEPLIPIEVGFLEPPWHLTRGQAEIVAREVDAYFPTLAGMTLVATWGSVETLVLRLVAAWIENVPEARSSDRVRRLERKVADSPMAAEERRIYVAQGLLREVQRSRERLPGVGEFEALLDLFGLAGPLSGPLTRTLIELRATRNVVVHRRGVPDERFRLDCPWVPVAPDIRLVVNYEDLLRYMWASVSYAQIVLERVADRFGVKLPRVELPNGLAASIDRLTRDPKETL
jgi:hypothetical protein